LPLVEVSAFFGAAFFGAAFLDEEAAFFFVDFFALAL
jgi:hypothetical protein